MGYALVFGECISCHKIFSFNPNYVTSVMVNEHKEPICQDCIDAANPIRKERGLPEIKVHPNAYEPEDESNLTY